MGTFANIYKRMGSIRLITHNMLQCHIKEVYNGYPFLLEVTQAHIRATDYNPKFLLAIFGRLDWNALCLGARAMGYDELPEKVDKIMLKQEDFLRKLHHVLLELEMEEGFLICPETGRKFPVTKGIPNLVLESQEI